MSVRVQWVIEGDKEVVQRIETGFFRLYIATAKEMEKQMLELRNYAATQTMHGQMVKQRTGNLIRNVILEVSEGANDITGRVGIPLANTAPYARILHDGGTTRAHVIEAKKAQALAFQMGGRMMFRKMVNHPGSKFPPRPYLKVALDARGAVIRTAISEAMKEAV